jgi:hypothetical protein
MAINEFLALIMLWREHPIGRKRRKNLRETDFYWEQLYHLTQDNIYGWSSAYVEQGTTLYRVHQNDLAEIEFDNHWVSFTNDPTVIVSSYFKQKGLVGNVIVLSSVKAVDISDVFSKYDEHEVVAPLSRNDVVEVISYGAFKRKYINR